MWRISSRFKRECVKGLEGQAGKWLCQVAPGCNRLVLGTQGCVLKQRHLSCLGFVWWIEQYNKTPGVWIEATWRKKVKKGLMGA